MAVEPAARASALLWALAERAPESISLGAIAAALEDRGFGIAILCLALPNALPGPYIPGLSAVLGLPIVWLGWQLALGRDHPQLPSWLQRRSLSRGRFVGFVARAVPVLARLERWLVPRQGWLTQAPGQRVPGLALVFYGLVLMLPVPFGNLPVGFAIAVLALGLIEQDNRALGWGLALGAAACLWTAALVAIGVAAAGRLLPYFK
jgi:hypothetical protein